MHVKGNSEGPEVLPRKFPDFSIISFLFFLVFFITLHYFKTILYAISSLHHFTYQYRLFPFSLFFVIQKLLHKYIFPLHICIPMIHRTSHEFHFPFNLPWFLLLKYQLKLYVSDTQKNITFLSHFASYFRSRYLFWACYTFLTVRLLVYQHATSVTRLSVLFRS